MAGLKGKSGPPGNMNAFKHGLAAIQKRREEGVPAVFQKFQKFKTPNGFHKLNRALFAFATKPA